MSETKQDKRWKKLMTRAQFGDEESYGLLLQEIYPVVRRYLVSRLGVLGYDEDFTQECLLSIHRARHSYDPIRPFAPWMYAVVKYKSIDVLRKRQRVRSRESSKGEDIESAEAEAGPTIIAREDAEIIQKALESLPDEMRRAVMLTKVQGLSTRDAAEVEEVSEGALRTRISRAYKVLRKNLEADFGH